jgi:Ulp1 family protease
LFDSLFNDVILGNLEQQVRNLVGQNFKEISVVSVQQQENGSDCGVFAIAFATALVYSLEPSATAFDVPKMSLHLFQQFK